MIVRSSSSHGVAMGTVQEWSVDEVRCWLEGNGFEAYTELLCDQHHVDGNALLMLQVGVVVG